MLVMSSARLCANFYTNRILDHGCQLADWYIAIVYAGLFVLSLVPLIIETIIWRQSFSEYSSFITCTLPYHSYFFYADILVLILMFAGLTYSVKGK